MRHVRMLGLCLVAAMAVTAIVATSASALPEWGKCVAEPKHEGKYTDSNCTKKAKTVLKEGKKVGTGEFEWKKGKEVNPVKFTGHNVGSGGVLSSGVVVCEEEEPVGSGKPGPNATKRLPQRDCKNGLTSSAQTAGEIECTSEENSGEAVSTKNIASVHVLFKGCLLLGSLPCTSSGRPNEGEVETKTLKGQLGYISKSKHEVGVLLTPAKSHGAFAEFLCNGGSVNQIFIAVGVGNEKEGAFYSPEKTGGFDGIISPITPVNTMTSEFTQVYTVNKEITQNIPSKFEGKHVDLLENYLEQRVNGEHASWDWSPAGEEITNVNTPAEPGEIKA